MRFCMKCQKQHRPYSRPWIECFGIDAPNCNLYHEGDKIKKVAGHVGNSRWPVKVGQTLKEFADEYSNFFNMGITVFSRNH